MSLISWNVGDVKITRVPEIVVDTELAGLLPDATPDAVAPHRRWLEPHFLRPDGTFGLSIHGLVVDTGDLRILVDTCLGRHPIPGYPQLADAAMDFPAALAAAGYPCESVDVVLCTHLHFDHVGWNTTRDGDRLVPTFPNANYLFARAEWEHWSTTPCARSSRRALPRSSSLTTGFVTQCVSCRPQATPPGTPRWEISSGDDRAFITGDRRTIPCSGQSRTGRCPPTATNRPRRQPGGALPN
jgi:glyoxylase-like metal-dependent hydrolase (beta-lactamase superfamily II)